jgi:hypothetical protein
MHSTGRQKALWKNAMAQRDPPIKSHWPVPPRRQSMKRMTYFLFFLLVLPANGLIGPLFAADEQRHAYDQMVEEATREADAYVEQKQKEHQEATEKRKNRSTPSPADDRVQAQRERIEAEIDKVRKRGLGPDFTEGMRHNRLEELQNELNKLNSQ